jgi:mRNA interferase HigB
MHLITRPRLIADAFAHGDIKLHVTRWCQVVRNSSWQSLIDVREVYPSADSVGNFTVFNIKSFRLIVGIAYEEQVVYYKYLLTHAEYDKNRWKEDPYF